MKYELTLLQENLRRAWRPCVIFLEEYNKEETVGGKRGVLKQYYKELFDAKLPRGIPLLWVQAKIGYRLQYLGFLKFGLEDNLSEDFIQNYKAMKDFDIKGVTEDTKILLKVY